MWSLIRFLLVHRLSTTIGVPSDSIRGPLTWHKRRKTLGSSPRDTGACQQAYRVEPQSPSPGASEKYFSSLPSSPSFSLASGSGSRRSVRLGQIEAYLVLRASHSSSPLSVSGLIASAGHSG